MRQALLAAVRSIALAVHAWRERAARRPMIVEISVLNERVAWLREQNDLLRARLRRLAPKRRPHYRRHERLAILAHAERRGLSVDKTARAFVVSVAAIMNWRRDTRQEKATLVEGKPPVNKLPDLVAEIARRLKREWPRWGTRRIAGALARLGLKASRTSVQASLRRRPTQPADADRAVRLKHGPLVANRPDHLWFLDFTKVGGIFRSIVVGAVIDGFSRKVLAVGVAAHEPTAALAVGLVRQATAQFGAPIWMVTDHGTQLTAGEFGQALGHRKIGHRYGAIGKSGSIAIIERWWKTLKEECVRGLVLFRLLKSIEAKLRAFTTWYNAERPYQGLVQRTPDEIHFGRETRGSSVPLRATLTAEFIDDDRDLPVLRLRDAA